MTSATFDQRIADAAKLSDKILFWAIELVLDFLFYRVIGTGLGFALLPDNRAVVIIGLCGDPATVKGADSGGSGCPKSWVLCYIRESQNPAVLRTG